MAEPSETERMEGLMQYTPFLVLLPHSCITHNYELGGDGAKKIVSAGYVLVYVYVNVYVYDRRVYFSILVVSYLMGSADVVTSIILYKSPASPPTIILILPIPFLNIQTFVEK